MTLEEILGSIENYYKQYTDETTANAQRAKAARDLAALNATQAGQAAFDQRRTELTDFFNKNQGIADMVDAGAIGKYIRGGDPTIMQGWTEAARSRSQLDKQNQQLADFRNRAETQFFGAPGATLEQALSSTSGDLGQLGTFLKNQQSDIFKEHLAPLTNMSLNAQGLLNSGANVELQSKALGDLERNRQNTLMNAALGYRSQMQGVERSDILGNIAGEQQALANMSDIQRAGITMQFQRELEDRRAQLAKELSQFRGGGSSGLGQLLGGGLGAIIGGVGAGMMTGGMGAGAGAMAGWQMGSGLGSGLEGVLGSNRGGSAIYGY